MSNKRPSVLFYVLHLLGVGHVYRVRALVEAMSDSGMDVDIIFGGKPVDGITFAARRVHFLPSIAATDNSFAHHVDGHGQPLTQDWLDKRRKHLLSIVDSLSPDAIITEAFPFGRRLVRHEILAMLDAAAARSRSPLIVSSVRDILQENRKPGRAEEVAAWVDNRFDKILVHSDPQVVQLDATFPLAKSFANKVAYTGFVTPKTKPVGDVIESDILVSAGGGAFGKSLIETALKCAKTDSDKKWLVCSGPNYPKAEQAILEKQLTANTTLRERVDNLSAHMKASKISISQCGYNTAMDVLAAHSDSDCRAVFVPDDTTGQTEQIRRAELLAHKGYAICLPQSQLSPGRLLTCIEEAAKLPRVDHNIAFDGASQSAALLAEWLEERS